MKKVKKIISLLATSAMLLVASLGTNTMTVSADEPTTFVIGFDVDYDDWRFQYGSSWVEDGESRELYYLEQEIKDGDIVVVNSDGDDTLDLKLPVTLSNLSIAQCGFICIGANRINQCYVLDGSSASISGYVDHAYVYNYSVGNFNGDVGTLEIFSDEEDINATVGVGGSCGHLYATDKYGNVIYNLYSFSGNTLYMREGVLESPEWSYSQTPGATPSAPAPAVSAAPTASAPATSSASSEYDDVPKTGDSNLSTWLYGVSIVCFVIAFATRKHTN